ncbi:MAG: rubrerythrin family protein [Oscillospiraceae bacterium]|jgi:rubrerythrin|nr:rubrerythrin family protein [Oscillospiraceae bacterium]
MDKQLTGTRTEKNLWAAFNGESAARAKYQLYAMQARIDGLHQVADIFSETADNELQHAKLWLRALNEYGQTAENLKKAQEGERFEWTQMYAEFERVAREEGFADLADQFHRAGEVEQRHDKRYEYFMKQLTAQTLFKKQTSENWKCLNCGYQHTGAEPPAACPLCKHPKGWFMAMPQMPE